MLLGIALRRAPEGVKTAIDAFSDALSTVVRWVISCAPFGVMGLVFTTISEQGVASLLSYGRLILLLVGTMAFVALVVNPIIVFIGIRKKPLSIGVQVPQGQRHYGFLYPLLGGQYPG